MALYVWYLALLLLFCKSAQPSVVKMQVLHDSQKVAFTPTNQCEVSDENARFDCMPDDDGGKTEQDCEARGCCWMPKEIRRPTFDKVFSADGKMELKRTYDVPWCFYPAGYKGYYVTNITDTDFGKSVTLQRDTFSPWPKDILRLQMDIYLEESTRLHFKIYDPAVKRYEVPIEVAKPTGRATTTDYNVSIRKDLFGITIRRISTGAVLFDSAIDTSPLQFADQFIQISTRTGTDQVYGLGEHKSHLRIKPEWAQYAFWAHDAGTPLHANLYGHHPFFLAVESSGDSHGVFLLNSNAMEILTQPLPALTYRTIGGILDFYIFTGPSPDDVIEQYTRLIGRPFLPPYWALGYHQCRWGYKNETEFINVVKRNRAIGIPYEVQWNDLDYMDSKLDFTYDKQAYPHLPEIVKELHDNGMKYIMIVDPGISITHAGKYPAYDEGIADDVFVKNVSGQPLIGQVWPGLTVFPDWTHPKTSDWWYRQIKAYHDLVSFDGLWIDMNEPANAMSGSQFGCTLNNLDVPPYMPGIYGNKLEANTLCASAQHHLSTHYNLHSLYGLGEAMASNNALNKILNKRSIVISRSSYVSLGRYAGHWSGDNIAIWDDLYYSIPLVLSFQMFGVSLVGADVCGFGGNSYEELCIRWMQLGAFYPFMRNHNDWAQRDQDPASWSPAAQKIMKESLELRYYLLPYLYTLFVRNHQTGRPVARPLFFEFVQDPGTYTVDAQLMWGSALLVSPALSHNQTSVDAYLPRGVWYDIYNGSAIHSKGATVTLDSPLEKINVHARGGYIVPLQLPAVTTVLSRKNPFELLVALDTTAKGELVWDDGETLDSIENGFYNEISFTADQSGLTSSVLHAHYQTDMVLNALWVVGLDKAPSQVTVNGQQVQFQYNADLKELSVLELNVNLLKKLSVTW